MFKYVKFVNNSNEKLTEEVIIMRVKWKRNRLKQYTPMVKYIVAVAIGTIITTTVITCKSTQSYFTSTALAEGNISAAGPQDIIMCKFETVKIVNPCKITTEDVTMDFNNPDDRKIVNPDKIKIYNKTGKNYIVIYFALDDKISKYLRPVNPIESYTEKTELEGNAQVKELESEVPINVDINIEQFLSLLQEKESEKSKPDKEDKLDKDTEEDEIIDGSISIKYLNNYINKTQKISFTKDYLMVRFLKGIQDDLTLKLAQVQSKKTLDENTIKSTASSKSLIAADSSQAESTTSEDKENEKDLTAENTDETMVQLTPEEEQLINYISPELLSKMNKLIDEEKSLKQIITELNEKINSIMSQPAPLPQVTSIAVPAASAPSTPSTAPVALDTNTAGNAETNPTSDTAPEGTGKGSAPDSTTSGSSASSESTPSTPAAGGSDSSSSASSDTSAGSPESGSSSNAAAPGASNSNTATQ
jgi:hypothetical protein